MSDELPLLAFDSVSGSSIRKLKSDLLAFRLANVAEGQSFARLSSSRNIDNIADAQCLAIAKLRKHVSCLQADLRCGRVGCDLHDFKSRIVKLERGTEGGLPTGRPLPHGLALANLVQRIWEKTTARDQFAERAVSDIEPNDGAGRIEQHGSLLW